MVVVVVAVVVEVVAVAVAVAVVVLLIVVVVAAVAVAVAVVAMSISRILPTGGVIPVISAEEKRYRQQIFCSRTVYLHLHLSYHTRVLKC